MSAASRSWEERERDPSAVGSRAWHRREIEAAERTIDLGLVCIVIVLFLVFIAVVAVIVADADGTVSEEHYRIGVDPVSRLYHRLYLPVYTEGNETEIHLSVQLETAGSGSPRFDVEFLDDANLVLRQMGTTYYERFATGSTGVTTTFDTLFTVNVTQGWPVGTYWFVITKETEGNDWCWVDFTLEYWTAEAGSGGLVERRFDGVEASVAAVTRAVELVDGRAAALEAALAGLRNELGSEVLNLKYLIERANYTQREEYLAALAVVDARSIRSIATLNASLSSILEGVAGDLENSTSAFLQALQAARAQAQADMDDLSSKVNASAARTAALEAENAALRVRLTALEGRVKIAEGNVTKLSSRTSAETDRTNPGIVLLMVMASIILGVVIGVYTTIRATKTYK